MTDHWDEFSKSLAEESVPRRESLRRLGVVLAGAVFSPLGLESAFARGPDPCKAFCNQCPKSQRSRCLAACNACNRDPSRLCGSCGSHVCCGSGRTCCSGYCTDLADDILNCGACGNSCEPPGAYEYGACVSGTCEYWCAGGTALCTGTCTPVNWDPDNCGACGNVCGGSTPYCKLRRVRQRLRWINSLLFPRRLRRLRGSGGRDLRRGVRRYLVGRPQRRRVRLRLPTTRVLLLGGV